jgi:hypothetical protein
MFISFIGIMNTIQFSLLVQTVKEKRFGHRDINFLGLFANSMTSDNLVVQKYRGSVSNGQPCGNNPSRHLHLSACMQKRDIVRNFKIL